MASIQRVKSPLTSEISYRAQVRVKGHKPQGKTFPNRKEAKQWGDSIESAIREGRYFPHQRAARTSFAEVAARYLKSGLDGLSPAARVSRQQHVEWWVEKFAGRTLAEITPDRVAEARDELAAGKFKRGKPRTVKGAEIEPKEYQRSGATTNRYLASLSKLFTVAMKEWRLVDRNPVRDISKRKESRGRVRFLTDDERAALLTACDASAWKPLRALVLLAISTGARRGEIITLKWVDVDLKAAQATVHETKNGDPRVLPLVGKALEALRELKLYNSSARGEWVFGNASGFPGPYVHFDAHWYGALKAADIKGLRFHDLRHTTASYLAQQGASLLEIADTLGHRTLAMVKRYSHLAQSHKATVIERMVKARGL